MNGPFLKRWHDTLRRCGGARAVVVADSGQRRRFADLENDSLDLARHLPGDRIRGGTVVLRLPNGADWITAFLTLHRLGACVLPVDADTPAGTTKELAEQMAAVGLWDDTGFHTLPPASGRKKARGSFLGKITSGTSGRPKVFFFNEAQMLADADAIVEAMGIRPDDLNLAGLPFAHSYALGNIILPLFCHGIPLVVASSHFPGVIAEEVSRHGATLFPTVPAIVSALASAEIPVSKFATLRRVISAGARLDPAVAGSFRARYGLSVHNFYGSSETGGIAVEPTPDRTDSGGIGLPLPGVALRLARDGRLIVAGPAVHTLNNRRKTQNGLGEFRMPDLAAIDPDGRVRLLGRTGDLLKIGGRRVAASEVERVLRDQPGVREAFVQETDSSGEPRLAALIIGAPIDTRELRSALRSRLPSWKIPSRFAFAGETPLTARGKPDRAAIRAAIDNA